MQADGHCGFRLVPGETSYRMPNPLLLIDEFELDQWAPRRVRG
jgi:hypothetical protein